MASPRTCTEMVEIGDLEADIREVGEVEEEQGEDKEEARDNGEVFLSCGDAAVVVMSEITPLLDSAIHAVQNPPKMNIFSVSYPRSRSKELVNKQVESDLSSLYQFMLWIWSGSKYSGFLCMAVSSVGYCIMELLLEIFSVESIPLFEKILVRCIVVLFMSFTWLRRSGQPLLGPPHVRNILIARALAGFLSLLCFAYSIQRLQPAYAILLNFTTPIAASIFARVILQEKLAIVDIGGLSCSFLGALFIFSPVFSVNGVLPGTLDDTSTSGVNLNVYDVIIGIVSSLMGGISYCFIRAGAKASDQPVVTVFAFAVIATPFAALSASVFQEIVVPDVGSLILMIVLGILAFIAEVFLSRGLQIEKTSKVTNIQYIQIILLEVSATVLLGELPSIVRLTGCALISASILATICLGPERVSE
ncbi:uncharacterized protein LOC116250545 isoform X3 [Nymphaea colorata]|uniref:uncharacterized protein LOC116250545 isoform X3 n=1 Tax=Nymphaea colorata TaxID=210225 RepID=UPI00129E89F4|nr:uncharacterized protein LOC116250545 isoform X3 [Nymphaea colorata]